MIIKRDVLYTPKNAPRTLHIYLPDSYYETDERYPVMYFFDGHNLFSDEDATYGKSWGLQDFMNQWEKPMILVGLECSHEGNSRLSEYCPYDHSGGFLGDFQGHGDATMRFIAEELKPMIDREYRTYAFREATAIGGSSMGGLMSVYAAIKYNSVFSKAACISSAISPFMHQLMNDFDQAAIDANTRVFLSWGTRETRRKDGEPHLSCNQAIADRFAQCGAATRIFRQDGGRHCEEDWEKQIPAFMDFLWLDR